MAAKLTEMEKKRRATIRQRERWEATLKKDLMTVSDLAEATGHKASKLRTWVVRDTQGLKSKAWAFVSTAGPLFRRSQMTKWIEQNRADQ